MHSVTWAGLQEPLWGRGTAGTRNCWGRRAQTLATGQGRSVGAGPHRGEPHRQADPVAGRKDAEGGTGLTQGTWCCR